MDYSAEMCDSTITGFTQAEMVLINKNVENISVSPIHNFYLVTLFSPSPSISCLNLVGSADLSLESPIPSMRLNASYIHPFNKRFSGEYHK